MKDQAFEFLSHRKPFSFLPKKEIQKIADIITLKRINKGAVISIQGKTKLDEVLIIKEGNLELFHETMGKRVLSGNINIGEVCNGIAILMNLGTALRTVVAEKDSECYVINKQVFTDLCLRYNNFHQYFVKEYNRLMVDESYSSVISKEEPFNFLTNVPPFSFLPESVVRYISSVVSVGYYRKDKVLFNQGRGTIEHIFIIRKGTVERYYEEGNKKILKRVLGRGDIFGGISILINNSVPIRTLKLMEKSYFYIFPKKEFLKICDEYKDFSEFFTGEFGKMMLNKSYASIIGKSIQPGEKDLQFFNQPISDIYNNNPVFCHDSSSIKEAASIMSAHRCSSIIVNDSKGRSLGIVTDFDFKSKVVSKGFDISKEIFHVMSSPLKSISTQDLIFDGLMKMIQEKVKHLTVTDADDKVVGIITNSELLLAQGQSPVYFIREISEVESEKELINKHDRLSFIIKNLIQSGAKADNVNKIVTTVADTVLNKIIGFAIRELGDPPCKFVFMIMGSEGRQEQTLKTDQDNAIIYEDVSESSEKKVNDYFLKFGKKVCSLLDQAGYEYCKGNIMAQNPEYCNSLSVWKNMFSKWIYTASQEDLLQASIFFDFKGAFGDMELINRLKNHLFRSFDNWSGFFRHLTENAMHFKPPLGFFRNFIVESKGKHRNSFNIKTAMTPIVDFARIYALKNRIEKTNTIERLRILYEKKVISEKRYIEVSQAYRFLMQFRFLRQISAIENGQGPDNYINPKKLSNIEQTMLKQIFKTIEKIQSKLSFEFLGIV